MISKKNFCMLINSIHEQDSVISELRESAPGLVEDLYDITGPVATTMVDVLAEEMDLPNIEHIGNTISWWIWECDYGASHPDITFKDTKTGRKKTLHLTTVEKLYDYLVKYEAGVKYEVRDDKK